MHQKFRGRGQFISAFEWIGEFEWYVDTQIGCLSDHEKINLSKTFLEGPALKWFLESNFDGVTWLNYCHLIKA